MMKNYTTLEQYNGWNNYQTWRINLEIFDCMTIEDFGFELADFDADDVNDVTDVRLRMVIESYVYEYIESTSTSGLVRDLAMDFVAKVDWMEIAEHLITNARGGY
jgi:hypothetical protein